MKLVYHNGTVGAIYFPVGELKNGGTCQFATRKCLKECGLKSNELVEKMYEFFKVQTVGVICEQVLEGLSFFPQKLLYWFASGECPTSLQDKVIKVMKGLSLLGISQIGFTRNKELWKKAQRIKNMTLILTVNTKTEALRIKEKGLVAVPIYACWKVDVYDLRMQRLRVTRWSCGGKWVEYRTKTGRTMISEDDCGVCYDKKILCFARIEKNKEIGYEET